MLSNLPVQVDNRFFGTIGHLFAEKDRLVCVKNILVILLDYSGKKGFSIKKGRAIAFVTGEEVGILFSSES